jgi:hypothetical protein
MSAQACHLLFDDTDSGFLREREREREGGKSGKWFPKMRSVNHFSLLHLFFFWSTENVFGLTKILSLPKHPKEGKICFQKKILRRNKRGLSATQLQWNSLKPSSQSTSRIWIIFCRFQCLSPLVRGTVIIFIKRLINHFLSN